MKIGKLKCSLEFLKDVYSIRNYRTVLGEILVLGAVTLDNNMVEYTALSDHFDDIGANDTVPYYELHITRKSEAPSDFTFKFSKQS